MRHSNRVRHPFQARRALGAEGHIRTACPRTACNNCLKMYVKVWHYSLQITIISQLFAWYIQSQHIYSNKTYSSNFWQHISNTKVILQKRTIPNSVPEGHKETLSIYNHPPSVGIIYPIATYIYSIHTYSPNCWQLISNTKVILQKPTLRNSVPEGHKETLSIYNHPPNVALFYPIAIYAHSFFWSSHQLMNYIFPLYIHILPTFTTM